MRNAGMFHNSTNNSQHTCQSKNIRYIIQCISIKIYQETVGDIIKYCIFRKWMEKIMRMKTGYWCVILVLVTILSCTQDGERWFEWETSDEGVIITNYKGRGENIRIPPQIQGMPVVGIEREAFVSRNWSERNNGIFFLGGPSHNLTGVIIPDSVTFIGMLAFGGNQLTNVIIPDSVTYIGDWAFAENQLSDATISNSILSIGNGIFARNRLTEIIIPETVISIGDLAFVGNQLSNIVIPDNVISIGDWAFAGNRIAELLIPHSVVSIGEAAFAINHLTSVTILDTDISIEDWAFAANQLTGIPAPGRQIARTPELDRQKEHWEQNNPQYDRAMDFKWTISTDGSVVSISGYLGESRNVRIPSQIFGMPVLEIGAEAFYRRQLSEVTIPDSVTHIGTRAFLGSGLGWVNIGNNVTHIDHQAFSLNSLFQIRIPNSVRIINSRAFFGNNLAVVTIPEGVTHIGDGAFGGNRLSGVTIPGSITYLGSRIFAGSDIGRITIGNNIEISESNGFPSRMVRLYNEHGRQAGIFTSTGSIRSSLGRFWSFTPQETAMPESEE